MTDIIAGELTALLYDGTHLEISGSEDGAPIRWAGLSEDMPEEYEGCKVHAVWPVSDGAAAILHVELEELPEED